MASRHLRKVARKAVTGGRTIVAYGGRWAGLDGIEFLRQQRCVPQPGAGG